jgi:predicted small integral membrane protein
MSFDTALLLSQAICVFLLTAWLSTGVFENLVHSSLNSTFTAEVMEMSRMREAYPEAYADVAYRRITNPAVQMLLFRLIVLWELLAVAALWVGFVALMLAVFGLTDVAGARALGLVGATAFTSVWGGFLIGGNWFCYWFCHEGAQNTHYQMTLWGLGTVLLVAVG